MIIDLAKESINDFSVDEEEYSELTENANTNTVGVGSIFVKDTNIKAKIKINFGKTRGCKIYLGKEIQGNFSVVFRGNNSLVYIGNNTTLRDVQIRSKQTDDFIAVGNLVTTTSKNVWISGNGSGKATPAIIIGDDCMFSYDVVIRNSDAHPVFDVETEVQINQPVGIVHIEPHVWIGEKVSVLKSVTVGACSILSLGAVVTKDVQRFSVAHGVPAKVTARPNTFWARNYSREAKEKALYYMKRYSEKV